MEVVGAVSNIAGIVSVGIQVCEGLVNYYNAWKGSKKENAAMIQSIESLLDSLSLLKRALESPTFNETMAINIESKIVECEESINELHDELKKIMVCKPSGVDQDDLVERKGSLNSSIKDKMTEQGRRLLYPFRKSTLMRLQESIEHITNISDGVNAMINQQMDKEGIKVLKWLSSLDCHSKQREILSRRQPGTGEWLFESPEFQNWINGEERFLWCSGSPGVGKTVLTSAIIDYLQRRFPLPDVAVAFIYCNYAEKNSLTEYITSIIQQILRQRYLIPDYVMDLYRKHRSMGTVLNRTESLDLLRSLAYSIPGLYIVVDALDECQESKKTRSDLIRELRNLSPNARVLCTSRRLGDIEEKLMDVLHLEIKASDTDVRAYLGARADSEENIVRFCKKDPTLRATIIERVSKKANGMFLLAHLHIEAIASELKISRVRKALVDLPEVLGKSYDDALKRISEGQDTNRRDLAMNILMWLSCAKRPLTVRELQHALAIMELDADQNELDEGDFYEQDLLLTVCAGLVVVDTETNIIRLCHLTTQEYFEKRQTELFPGAQVSIAQACIRYLSLDIFNEVETIDRALVKQRLEDNAFLSYASQFLGAHTQGNAETELKATIVDFLGNEKLTKNGYAAHNLDASLRTQFPAITAAAAFGLPAIVDDILQSGADIEATSFFDMTSLLMAAGRGHESVVSKLISARANLRAQDEYGQNALHKAAEGGCAEIARQLIDAQPLLINGNLSVPCAETPLDLAISNCNEDIVDILLPAGTDVNTCDDLGFTPLAAASVNNLPQTIGLLVSKGANMETTDHNGHTPLSIAATMGNTQALKKLLEVGAKVDLSKEYLRTPLAHAAGSGHKDAVNVLLKYGADVNMVWP
ncbi:hypothetical protein ACMFMG_001486 [Clarireedia jacksonii]